MHFTYLKEPWVFLMNSSSQLKCLSLFHSESLTDWRCCCIRGTCSERGWEETKTLPLLGKNPQRCKHKKTVVVDRTQDLKLSSTGTKKGKFTSNLSGYSDSSWKQILLYLGKWQSSLSLWKHLRCSWIIYWKMISLEIWKFFKDDTT